jgi:hypothetical protein
MVACSSSSNPAPSQPVYTVDAGDGSTGLADTGTADSTGSNPDAQPSQDAQGALADGASDAATCPPQLSDAGCWTCPTQTDASVQYLNQCSGIGVRCVPFSNAALPGYDASGLPPLN